MNIEFCKCSGIGTKNWEKGEHFIISAFIPTDFIAQNYSEKELKYINNEPLTKFWGNKILTKKSFTSVLSFLYFVIASITDILVKSTIIITSLH